MEALGDERGKISAGLRHAGTSQFTYLAVLSVRPDSCRSSNGYSLANCELYSCIFHFPFSGGKGALGPLLSAPAGASKGETPTSNLNESTACTNQSTEELANNL